MGVLGWLSALRPHRRPARPAVGKVIDCAPWITGGLWPAELSTISAETMPFARYLRADLQRIVDAANKRLEEIRRTTDDRTTALQKEARIIAAARVFAEHRVESTVRQIRDGRSGRGQEAIEALATDNFATLNSADVTSDGAPMQ